MLSAQSLFRRALLLSGFAVLSACSSPAVRIDHRAERLGFQRRVVQGREFAHVVYLQGHPEKQKTIHVYIEGDGKPWIRHKNVAADPTPRSSLMLKLMALDDNPVVIFLGRPCYHGFSETPPCSPLLWTHQRYSLGVINSMAAALRRLLAASSAQIVLIGHSGGGTLAMLLAQQMSQVSAVVTVAANLDVAAWAKLHDYSPLTGSLSPASQPRLRSDITQLHVVGEDDRNVPVDLIRATLEHEPQAELLLFEGQDHSCCWETVWPSILERLK